ncbi:sensor domain-containing diguanylate cyclase [Pararhizobium sp.]|uniref:sensor domain-containing diguanylate cyclase n=1 Tax=Pararhizobium sp. TaxID=1977563 RepID=UPI0027191899|nr:sensor domain-containing diguanylate cyclase [Pararhizobium sp.]MDO9417262.1 sensor domain-containing diguanylate cyclase [Pararhizobium sp.]
MVAARAFGKSVADDRENLRLAALEQLDLLDTPKDEGFERIVRLIKEIFSVDIALVSLIDAHRQWYKACSGLAASQVAREDTFCRYVVDLEEAIVVQDASKDARFALNPAVTGEAHIRFYAGVPLKTRDGHTVGTVCAIDRRPRSFSDRDRIILEELAGAAMDRIELQQSAATDSLTGALTRRAFRQEADQLISLATRHKHDLSCIALDIDHFKRVNDTHGHAAGDDVLKAVATICKAQLRAGDVFGRLGGEEFAILLPHIDREGAVAVAEKLRLAIAAAEISGDFGTLGVTVSLGVSTVSIVSRDIETLLSQADIAMYQAKNNGRNCCVSWSSVKSDNTTGMRRRVLKAGTILFNSRRSTVDCTIKSLGNDSAGLQVINSSGIPPEFVLMIKGEGFETNCKVIAQDMQTIEVSFV